MTDNPAQSPNDIFEEIKQLQEKINNTALPAGLKEKVIQMLTRLNRIAKYSGFLDEFEKISHYIDWVVNLPWQKKSEDILDLRRAKEILDKNHYGMTEIKEKILEFMAALKLSQTGDKISSAPILCLVGLVGTGKTTFGYSLAEAMARKFSRIPFGGMGSALDLRGQSRLHPDNEPGQVIKALKRAQTNNPVILLDEIDRVAENARADIMGVLVELLDPEQNEFFIDHYLDYPFNLSNILFIATCNNTTNISTAVLDRMEILQMPSYSDEEKIAIGKNFILPKTLEKNGLTADNLTIDQELWPKIARPLGFDPGIRSLERTINNICRKIAKLVVENKGYHFNINQNNLKEFIPLW